MALITKPETKKARKQAKKTANAAGSSAQQAEKAVDELKKLAGQVGPVVTEGAREARTRATDLYDQYAPAVEERLRSQGEKVTQNLGPRAEKIVHDVQDDYYPRARKTAETTGNVLRSAVDAARKELDKGQGSIKSAALTPTPKPKKGRAGKVLLILGLAAAGAAAGYIVWQKTRPVEDPWAPPADFARAHYPASAANESDSSTVSDTVGSADAGDVASSLKTEDRASDTAPKEVKVDSAQDDATGKVIDPVADPEENPADPAKKGTHRGEA